MRIEGRCALITGAGSGLGRATARALSAAGARLVLVDLNEEPISRLADELGGAAAAPADVANETAVEHAVQMALDRFGRLDIALSCAGVPASRKLLSGARPHDLELWQRVLNVNLTGTFNVMRFAAAAMLSNDLDEEERGVIINTASVAAFDGQRGQVAYAASKAAIAGMTLPAARDLADHAIRCVAVAPGLFRTELFDQIPQKAVEALKDALLHPARMGEPAEFAAFVRHIIENPYVNGSCLRLDGAARLPA